MDITPLLARALPDVRTSADTTDTLAYARDFWPRRNFDVRDGTGLSSTQPAAVAWPTSTEQVAGLVRFCADEGIALVPFGAGSGVCGGVHPTPRTLVIDLKRMTRWRSLDTQTPTLDVESGANGIHLEYQLQAKGWTIGHFPSSILCSTPGGWVAARGAGQCSGRYGKVEDMVASLELVDGRGHVHEIHRRVNGPDLIPLIVGSEGTMGIITSTKFRLHAEPVSRVFAAYSFPSMAAGWTAMQRLYQNGLRPAVCRLYDPFDSFLAKSGSVKKREPSTPGAGSTEAKMKLLMRALRFPKILNASIDAVGDHVLGRSTLVLIYEGHGEVPRADSEIGAKLCEELGGVSMGDGPARKWLQHRYSVSYRVSPIVAAGGFADTLEVAAPWSKLAHLHEHVRHALGKHMFVMAHLSHAYPDGCSIYFSFVGSARDDKQARLQYDRAWRDAMTASIEAGGTLSHHHGAGRSKAARMGLELGHGVEVLRASMRAFDPSGILNPGNLIPNEDDDIRTIDTLPAQPPLDAIVVDGESLLASVPGHLRIREVSARLAQDGLSIDAPADHGDMTIAEWLGRGAPGGPDPWDDPVDHLVAGLLVDLADGRRMHIRPMPRRASGPDLMALFLGTEGRVGTIKVAHLRVHPRGVARAHRLPYNGDRNPPMTSGERILWRSIEREVTS